MNTALFIGRFQPFHNGHYKSVKKLISKYDLVIIGIGSSEKSHEKNNPFTFSERKKMIYSCFPDEKGKIKIIAIPDIDNDKRWVSHVVSLVPEFSIVYSNNPWVKRLFRKAKIQIGHTKWYDRMNCMAKRIRENIAKNKNWRKNVPVPVARYLIKIKGEKRIRLL